jgi:hypothetical protein
MKKISVILGLLALFFMDLAFAANAVVTSITGSAQVRAGNESPRTLRTGDEVNQGDTVSTGANSSIVMKFDDGQVAALTSNSRMTVTTYRYDAGAESGNVFLSLIGGGMRTITGLIGRRNHNNVVYRAATATIGIRGTDGTIVTNGTDVVVTVTEGSVEVNVDGHKYLVTAGNAIYIHPGSAPVTGTIAQVTGQIPQAIASSLQESTALTGAIVNVNPGTPRQGQGGEISQGSTIVTQTGTPPGGAGGGGSNASRN